MTIADTVHRHRTIAWLAATVLIALALPGGGFIVAVVSRVPRFRAGSPHLGVLLGVATGVLLAQVLGLAAWQSTTVDVGPIEAA